MNQHRQPGDLVVRCERLGLQPSEVVTPSPATGVWLALPVYVVEDSADRLLTYTATGAELGLVPGDWPTEDGLHPWHGRTGWTGHGCLMVQEPGEHHAIWHFWEGDDRRFVCWYLNIQTAFVRTAQGHDTQDLELDLVVFPDGSHIVKDAEVLDDRVAEGRFSAELVDWVRGYGDGLVARLESDGPWWDTSLVDWEPDPSWSSPRLPAGWTAD